jgi:hypothetical protein
MANPLDNWKGAEDHPTARSVPTQANKIDEMPQMRSELTVPVSVWLKAM